MQTINEIPQNILVIQQRQIGDVVVTTPVFETVKKAFPKAKLTFLTEQKCVPLVEKDPWLDEILAFPKNKGVLEQLAFYWSLHKKNFDVRIVRLRNILKQIINPFQKYAFFLL